MQKTVWFLHPKTALFMNYRHLNATLLLLPALALLAAFTHYPAIATIIDSFCDAAICIVGLNNSFDVIKNSIAILIHFGYCG